MDNIKTSEARHYPIHIEHEGQTAYLEYVKGELVYGGTMSVSDGAKAFFEALKPHFEEFILQQQNELNNLYDRTTR